MWWPKVIRVMNREEGVTVFLTSHDVGDMERLCCSGYTVVTEEIMLARSRMVKARSIAYLTGRPCHYVLLKLSPFAYVRASAAF
jgi:ABC-2 type transport system ATP-binding protein